MASPASSTHSHALALATSQIHRCKRLEDLQQVYLQTIPQVINADAFGMYLFDDRQQIEAIFSGQANQHFLDEYEGLREEDPLFKQLRKSQQFIHSLGLFESSSWQDQPLHQFLCRWGLKYSIEAPLISQGKLAGTLNIARGGNRYFDKQSISAARFLCNEINYVYQQLAEQEAQQASSRLKGDTLFNEKTQQVFDLAVAGDCNRAIATKLNISSNTVRYHIKQIYHQLGIHNRAQLVQYALNRTPRIC